MLLKESDWIFHCSSKVKKSNLNQDEIGTVIDAYREYKQGNLYDSEIACIESIIREDNNIIINLCKGYFYEFLITNIICNQKKQFMQFIDDKPQYLKIKKIVSTKIHPVNNQKYSSLEDVIDSGDFVNALAVSVLIRDINNNYLVVKRSNKTIVASNMYGVSVTGSVDSSDLDSINPIIFCACRETKEELGIEISAENMIIRALVAGRNKCQPIAIVDAFLNCKWNEVESVFAQASDFDKENAGYKIISSNDLLCIAENEKMTEAARYHMMMQEKERK